MPENNTEKFRMHIVPHTHWDREWYYSLEKFRYRLIRLLDLLIDLMEKDRIRYFILDGQTIAIEDYLSRRPENRKRLEKLISDERIFIGPWYTQPNIFMSCAEAQVRNLEFGAKDIDRYGGGLSVNYMPDQFGFNTQLPQLMRGFGIDVMVGGRGMDKGSDTYFIWEGADGTRVKACALPHSYINAHCISTNDDPVVFDVFGCNIRMAPLKEQMDVILSERPRCPAPVLLALNGVDHMFPNPTMPETVGKINRDYPEVEAFESNFDLYLKDVEASLTRELYLKKGELRDPRENLILPASQSMRMDTKMKNIACEDALIRNAEPSLAVMTALSQPGLPESDIGAAWEIMLQNHAHDSLCCANSESSYREIMSRYDSITDITYESQRDIDQHFIRLIEEMPHEAIVIKNPSPFDRDEPVSFDVITAYYRNYSEPHLYCGEDEIPCRINGVRCDTLLRFVPFSGRVGELQVAVFEVTAYPGVIPALGYKTLEIRGGRLHARPTDGLVTSPRKVENEYLTVTVADDATITITDKATGNVYTGLNSFIDNGESGNGFQHIPPYRDFTAVSCGDGMTVEIVENNPEVGSLRIRQTVTVPAGLSADRLGRSAETVKLPITSTVTLKKGVRRAEFVTEIDNIARDHRLRVAFPTDCESDTAYCGQPFDITVRPVQPENVNYMGDGEYEPYVGYHPMQDLCGITDGKRGAAVAAGLLEYEVLPMRRTLALTLLRATDRLLVGVLATGSEFALPAAQLQKKMTFRYSFIPHTGGYENALREADAARHPLTAVQKDFLEEQSMPDYREPTPLLPLSAGFIRIDGDAVMTSLRPSVSEKGCVSLRFFNPKTEAGRVTVTVDGNYTLNSVSAVRIDEKEEDDRDTGLSASGNSITLRPGAKQIITLRMSISRKKGKAV